MSRFAFRADPGTVPPPARRLLGRVTGMAGRVEAYTPARAEPSLPKASAATADLDRLLDREVGRWAVGGKGGTAREAAATSLGELAERYCVRRTGLPTEVATHRELAARDDAEVVGFRYLDVLDDDRVAGVDGMEPLGRDDPLRWCEGRDLRTGERVLVPAQLVRDVTFEGTPFEPRFASTTSGCAAGATVAGALRRSVLEAVERDAFMLGWLRQESPGSVPLDALPAVGTLADRLSPSAARFHLLRYPSEAGLPAAGCAVTDRRGRFPRFVLGGAAARSPATAFRDALLEGAQAWVNARHRLAGGDPGPVDVESVLNFHDNVTHYARPGNFDEVAFLLDGPAVAPPEPPDGPGRDAGERRRLRAVVDALADAGMRPIAFELTTRDLRDAGWRVTRVYVPELVDLALPSLLPADHPAVDGEPTTDRPHPFG